MDPRRTRTLAARCQPRRLLRAILLIGLPVLVLVLAVAAQEGSGPSGVIDDGWRQLEWQMSGVDIGDHYYSGPDRCWTGPIKVTSSTVTFSGVLRASVAEDLVTTASMSAYLLNHSTGEIYEVKWPDGAKGETGDLGKPGALSHELPFSFTVKVSPGQAVWATASVSECGGVCDLTGLCFFSEPAPDTLAGEPTLAPTASPTAEPLATATPKKRVSWVGVVVGVGAVGMVAVAGLATAAALALRSRGKRAQQEEAHYILQLSADRIELAPGESKPLTVTAWRVTAEGGYVPAPEASIQVQVPPQTSWLQVVPVTGQGSLQCTVSLRQPVTAGDVRLVVTGLAGGARTEAAVTVTPCLYQVELF